MYQPVQPRRDLCTRKDHQVSDALSRWAYPAGLDQDVSFHGGLDGDLHAQECDVAENAYDDFPIGVTPVQPQTFYFVGDPRRGTNPSVTSTTGSSITAFGCSATSATSHCK